MDNQQVVINLCRKVRILGGVLLRYIVENNLKTAVLLLFKINAVGLFWERVARFPNQRLNND